MISPIYAPHKFAPPGTPSHGGPLGGQVIVAIYPRQLIVNKSVALDLAVDRCATPTGSRPRSCRPQTSRATYPQSCAGRANLALCGPSSDLLAFQQDRAFVATQFGMCPAYTRKSRQDNYVKLTYTRLQRRSAGRHPALTLRSSDSVLP